ncbi:hypothetical protein B0H11DRAFT_1255992 [Mycena galericulata]|nr:hypothetical protein B0H11DRAFT_1255992 [Mycena galericulata]
MAGTSGPRSPQLSQDILYLGLPEPSLNPPLRATATTKSCHESVVSLGWRIGLDQNLKESKLWTVAERFIKEFAQSDPKKIIAHIKFVRDRYFVGNKNFPIKISSHYLLEEDPLKLKNDFNPAPCETHLLKVCLHYVVVCAEYHGVSQILEWVDMKSGQHHEPQAYPAVDFVFDEKPNEPAEVEFKKLREAGLKSILGLTNIALQNSAAQTVNKFGMDRVESALTSVFHGTPKLHVFSGDRTAESPGIALLIIRKYQSRRGHHNADPSPPDDDSEEPKTPAQMATALHSTLILLVLAHYRRHNLSLSQLSTSKTFPEFDEKSMVYGISYNDKEIRIYTHFPQVELVEGRYVIRFYQFPVATFSLVDTIFLNRWLMAIGLFCVQKHAEMISGVLVDTIESYTS